MPRNTRIVPDKEERHGEHERDDRVDDDCTQASGKASADQPFIHARRVGRALPGWPRRWYN
jgi:hypothetical protein